MRRPLLFLVLYALVACARVPFTNRAQLLLLNPKPITSGSF